LFSLRQNPIEHEGTYRLPEAELDRFLFKVEIDYPTLEQETKILLDLHDRKNVNDLSIIQPVLSPEQLADYREKVRKIHIDNNIAQYIARIISGSKE